MELHTPSAWTFWLSVALVVLAIIMRFAQIPQVAPYAAWIGVVGYLVLVAGCRRPEINGALGRPFAGHAEAAPRSSVTEGTAAALEAALV